MSQTSLVGMWTYRSFISNPDLATAFNDLEFGRANLRIEDAPAGVLKGKIFDTGWSLDLNGSIDPPSVKFRGKGVVGGEEWVYDYSGYIVEPWPNGVNQRPAIVGSIVRTIPHGSAKAGIVASWIAVYQTE
jgi:hypothetical protein